MDGYSGSETAKLLACKFIAKQSGLGAELDQCRKSCCFAVPVKEYMLEGLKNWFTGGEKVTTAKERIADLEGLRDDRGDLSKKHRAHLEAAEKTVMLSRRDFHLKVGAAFAVAVAGSLGAAELVKNNKVDRRRESISEASFASSRIDATEESLQSFIPKFEAAFIEMCENLAESGDLPAGAAQRVEKLRSLVERNAAFGPDGRNFKTRQKTTKIDVDDFQANFHSHYFFYNVEAGHPMDASAAHNALKRFVEFQAAFDYENVFDLLTAFHEINNVYQDIERRKPITPLDRPYFSYIDRYVPKPGIVNTVNIDDENDSYSLQVELLNACLGGKLKEAAQAGELDDIEALTNEFMAIHPQNSSTRSEEVDYTIDLYEYILAGVNNPEIIEEMRGKAQVLTADQVASFIPILSFSGSYFVEKAASREYVKRLFGRNGVLTYENDSAGMFKRVN